MTVIIPPTISFRFSFRSHFGSSLAGRHLCLAKTAREAHRSSAAWCPVGDDENSGKTWAQQSAATLARRLRRSRRREIVDAVASEAFGQLPVADLTSAERDIR